jgi:hypothetical protein
MYIKENFYIQTFIHIYHSRFNLEGAAETSQIFLGDTQIYQMTDIRTTALVTGGKPIAVLPQFFSLKCECC